MGPFDRHRVPLITACWMIGVPLVFAFVAGAGAGTAFDGIARYSGTIWAGFGGASVLLGIVLLAWVLVSAWRGRSDGLHD